MGLEVTAHVHAGAGTPLQALAGQTWFATGGEAWTFLAAQAKSDGASLTVIADLDARAEWACDGVDEFSFHDSTSGTNYCVRTCTLPRCLPRWLLVQMGRDEPLPVDVDWFTNSAWYLSHGRAAIDLVDVQRAQILSNEAGRDAMTLGEASEPTDEYDVATGAELEAATFRADWLEFFAAYLAAEHAESTL